MSLDDTLALLSEAELFELVERDALRLMAFAAETRRLRAGEYLFREGERSDGGYVVMSGALAVGKESGVAAIAGRGALIGRIALFVRMKRPVSAVARERSEVLRISPTMMKRMLEEFPAAAIAIRDALADELAGLSADLEEARRLLAGDVSSRGAGAKS